MIDGLAEYSQEIFSRQLAYNFAQLSIDKTPQKHPIAYLLAGQSGAGKTTLHKILRHENQDNSIIIDGDSFRGQHPHAKAIMEKYGKAGVTYTSAFSGCMAEALIEKFAKKKYNLIIEGTLRTSEIPLKTARLLQSEGYILEIAGMATKPLISYLSTILRYEEMFALDPQMARSTSKATHDQIVDHLPHNLEVLSQEGIFQDIRFFTRDSALLFSLSQTPDCYPNQIMEQFFLSPLTFEEKEMFEFSLERIRMLMQKRNAKTEEFQELEKLIKNY